ncbi:MAG: DUF4190 domain-containing protein [Adlercreutzia equolifaciens]
METQPRSAMAVASLVLGIVALVTSILPIINNLSFLLAILGIVFAIIGLVGISKGKKSGKGLGIAGLVLSVIAFILVARNAERLQRRPRSGHGGERA